MMVDFEGHDVPPSSSSDEDRAMLEGEMSFDHAKVGPARSSAGTRGEPGLFTVGHSNISLEAFLALLILHHIEVVADVRTSPRSRYVPHFDARPLRDALARHSIKYVPLGRELGGRPEGDEFYDEGDHVLYGRLALSPAFEDGIERVVRGSKDYRVALLCSEENPSACHRHLLIGRVLCSRGFPVWHIRGDGRLESEEAMAATEGHGEQPELFSAAYEERQWRSIRSVSRKRVPLSSLGH
jgi:hypothetical protein